MKSDWIKNPAEIEQIAAGGKILAQILKAVSELVRPGISTAELNEFTEKAIQAAGAEPSFRGYGPEKNPFPAALCTSVNDVIVHGIPSKLEILRAGDLIGLDLGIRFRGFYSDAAITMPVGSVSLIAEKLITAARRALTRAIATAKPGKHIGDVSSVIQTTAETEGFNVVRDLVGHGVGYAVHEEPAVPCYGKPGAGPELTEGMVLAIEPMFCAGEYKLIIEPGEWPARTADRSLTAHFEHTVAITKNGSRVLTQTY